MTARALVARLVAAATAALLLPAPAAAFTRQAAGSGADPVWIRWASFPVPYAINEQTSDALPNIVDGSDPVQAIHRAFRSWQDVRGAAVAFQYSGLTARGQVEADGYNVVTFVDYDYPYNGRLAVASYTYYTASGDMYDVDITFNPAVTFHTSGHWDDGSDILAVAVHEVGHLLGIDHAASMGSTMSHAATELDYLQRRLHRDDLAAIAEIHPAPSYAATVGTITGTITRGGAPVFGAHVMALDPQSRYVVGALSLKNGSYRIPGLPPGRYRLLVEPVNAPLQQGHLYGWWQSAAFDTAFRTTWRGAPEEIVVEAGQTVSGKNVAVIDVAPGINPSYILRTARTSGMAGRSNSRAVMTQGDVGLWNLTVSGGGLASPADVTIMGAGVPRVTAPYYGTFGDGMPFVNAGWDPATDAPPGLRMVHVALAGETGVVAGALEILPRTVELTVTKDPLDPDGVYLSWYGREGPWRVRRDARRDFTTPVTLYEDYDLDYTDPVRNDGQVWFYQVD